MQYIDYECAGIQKDSCKDSPQIDLRESIFILTACHKFLPLPMSESCVSVDLVTYIKRKGVVKRITILK